MRAFDVDTNDGLLSSRRTEEDVWWHQAEKQQQAKSRHRVWLIAVTAVALLGLALGLAAVGTASVAVRRASTAGLRGEGSSVNAATRPGWDPISSIAFSSCTSYDVRPQPIWTEVSRHWGVCAWGHRLPQLSQPPNPTLVPPAGCHSIST